MQKPSRERLTSWGGPESTHLGSPVSFKVRIIPGREGGRKVSRLIIFPGSCHQGAHSSLNQLLGWFVYLPLFKLQLSQATCSSDACWRCEGHGRLPRCL